jgi:hypothetical protein
MLFWGVYCGEGVWEVGVKAVAFEIDYNYFLSHAELVSAPHMLSILHAD